MDSALDSSNPENPGTVDPQAPERSFFAGNPFPHGRWIACAIWLFLLLALIMAPLLLGNRQPRWDSLHLGYPGFVYISDAYAEGRFPLWDPFTGCGTPFHVDFGVCISPLYVLPGQILGSAPLGYSLGWLFMWWWAGVGVLVWCRSRGYSVWGGMLAALTFMFSGIFIGNAQHLSILWVGAWAPWLTWCVEQGALRSHLGFGLLAGLCGGFGALGGYPSLQGFSFLAAALWVLLDRWFALRATGLQTQFPAVVKRVLATCLVAGIITFLMWSPSLNAFFQEGTGFTDRVEPLSPEVANHFGIFPPSALPTIFFPFFPLAGVNFLPWDVTLTNGFCGVFTPFLMIFFLLERRRQGRFPWQWILFAGFMLLMSFGGKGIVRLFVNVLFPPLKFMRHSSFFRVFWMLPLSLGLGAAVTTLLEAPTPTRETSMKQAWFWTAFLMGLAAILVTWILPLEKASAGLLLRIFGPGLLGLGGGAGLIWISRRRHQNGPGWGVLALLVLLVHVDLGFHFWNNQATVWEAANEIPWAESHRKRETVIHGEPGGRGPPFAFGFFNAQQVLKVFVAQGYITLKNKGFDEILCQSPFLSVLRSPVRFWLSPAWEGALSGTEIVSRLKGISSNHPVPVLMEDSDILTASTRDPVIPGTIGTVSCRLFAPEEIQLSVDNPGSGPLVLASTERFARGWQGWVDGESFRVLKVNGFFRGLFVPPGRHQVVFRYRPFGWNVLVALSLATVLGTSLLAVWFFRPPKK